ncbi:MAG: sensor histidine kinase, partial [Sphaerochaetaceae bacterium]
DEGKVKGFLCYDISTQSLDNILHKEKVDIVVLTDQFDNTIYCSDNSLVNSMGKSLLDWKDTDTVLNNGKPYYATSNLLTSYNVKVITLTSTLAQSHFFKLGELFLVLLLAFMILLIFILGQRTARNSLQPINVLLNAIQQFLGGNLEYRIKERTFDEFQILFDGFNQMMVKLQALLKNNSELLERKRLMEVKQLEKQFNPHFVYNVLETLKYEILINQKQASQMVVTFANLMRYSINYGNGKVSLGTDIKYVQDYLLLQKMRFSDRLSYSLHVDESLLNCQIPKLLIQPIVENCLSHGIEDEKALNIQIQVKEDAGNINFIVTDNGCGIQPERLASLKKLFETEDAMPEHIGLYDVEREVKLLYGNGYGLDIASEFGNGTRVCLTIPYEARPDNV